MALIKSIKIEKNTDAVITIGEKNIVEVIKNIKQVKETNISSEGETWSQVIEKLKLLQRDVFSISEENEELRDQEIIPSLSKAKKEATILKDEPTKSKTGFLDSFKSFCEAVVKIVGVTTTIAPVIISICQLVGIPAPAIG